jgi:hypothetical protein
LFYFISYEFEIQQVLTYSLGTTGKPSDSTTDGDTEMVETQIKVVQEKTAPAPKEGLKNKKKKQKSIPLFK